MFIKNRHLRIVLGNSLFLQRHELDWALAQLINQILIELGFSPI
jgi:hypothetical protein